MLLVWGPHSDRTGLSYYQLLLSTYGLAYQAIETRRSSHREVWTESGLWKDMDLSGER